MSCLNSPGIKGHIWETVGFSTFDVFSRQMLMYTHIQIRSALAVSNLAEEKCNADLELKSDLRFN